MEFLIKLFLINGSYYIMIHLPVQSALKFSHVFGHMSANSSHTNLPATQNKRELSVCQKTVWKVNVFKYYKILKCLCIEIFNNFFIG